MREYRPNEIEKKWQEIWDEKEIYKAEIDQSKPKFYALVEFPYPSAEGLHVGHPRPTQQWISWLERKDTRDIMSYSLWDGIPLAYQQRTLPLRIRSIRPSNQRNIQRFKSQLKSIGFPLIGQGDKHYRPRIYEMDPMAIFNSMSTGPAYKREMPINWCTSYKIGLANEEVVNNACERCGGEVVQRSKPMDVKITEYADRLIDDLDTVDFIDRVKLQQTNWIGRSNGMEIDFQVAGKEDKLRVFTTRPDTIFGSTYMVIAVEHPLIEKYKDEIENFHEIVEYRGEVSKKSEIERTDLSKEKTGIEIKGLTAINPATGKEIPIWVSDYVLMSYGTGAIMAVPGHDERDWEFADKFGLPIVEVIQGGDIRKEAYTDTEDGILVNSDFLNGLSVKDAQEKISDWLEEKGLGQRKVNYKLRDWVFSRQRYWGEPIPLVHCDECGWVPVPEEDLPVLLPDVENYEPTDTGESPLANIDEWVNTTCPTCGKPAHRETDTMPNWAGSSWYFLRYLDPQNDKEFASREAIDYWMNVDWYNGGMEHTTLHLLYSRFWHKFFYDIGLVSTPEPYQKRTSTYDSGG